MTFPKLLLFTALSALSFTARSQDELLDMLQKEEPKQKEPVVGLFKTTRLINLHSTETVSAKELDFRITHRFGDVAGERGGYNSFYGFDDAANIRFALEYGITDKLMVGFARSSHEGLLDGFAKYKLLRQTSDNSIPVAVTLLGDAAYTSTKPEAKNVYRLSYLAEAIIARKITDQFTAEVVPMFLHQNLAESWDNNNLFSVAVGGRYLISRSTALMADYIYTFSDYRHTRGNGFYPALALGVEIETGGHVFHMNFTNAVGIVENQIIPATNDSWEKGQFKFGFNISRTFNLGRRK
jgi:hypothetical protein